MPKYPRVALFLPFAVLLLGVYVLGQSEAQQLARSVVQNEWNARQEGSPTPWTYLLHTDESGKKEILDVVHCVDGPVYRVLSHNSQPLNTREQKAEVQRLKKLVADPEQQQENSREYWHDVRQGLEMLRILPAAAVFRIEAKSGEFLRLSFQPNPKFHPDSRTARLIHALKGTMLVHPAQKRLAELRGVLDENVKFGGGILGTIRKGGSLEFRQTEISPGEWMATLVDVNLSGRALLFHSLDKQEHWVFSDFHRISPKLTIADAVRLLELPPERR
jgi:hypothetical protein